MDPRPRVFRLEHIGALAEVEGEQRVLLDEQDGDSLLLVQPSQEYRQLLDDDRGEPERELVDREQPRLRHQRTADRDHLLLASRCPARRAIAQLAELGQELVDALEPVADVRLLARVPDRRRDDLPPEDASVSPEDEVRLDGERREDLPALGNLADAAVAEPGRRAASYVLAVDPDNAGGGLDHAAGSVEDRALARPVRPDQRHPLTLANVKRHSVDCGCSPVADADGVDLEKRRHSVADPR